MRKFALLLTYLFAGTMVFFAVKGDLLFEMLESLTFSMLLVVGAVRIGYGVTLIGAAATSRMPGFLKFLGAFVILAGIATPLLGVEIIRALVDGIYKADVWILRSGCMFATLIFGFVAYTLAPREDDPDEVQLLRAAQPTGEIK